MLPPALVIHGLAHARAALAPGRPVTLLSAPAAAVYGGVSWWRAVIEAAATDQPDLLDCADAPGRALEALAVGCRRLILLPCPAHASVAHRAAAYGAQLLAARPAALDLASLDLRRPYALGRIEAWLGTG